MAYRFFLLLVLASWACAQSSDKKYREVTLQALQGVWALDEQKPSEGEIMEAMWRKHVAPETQVKELEARIANGDMPKRTVTLTFRGNIMTVAGMSSAHSGSQASSSRFNLAEDRMEFDAPNQPGAKLKLGRTTLLYVADAVPKMGLPAVRYLYRRVEKGRDAASLGDREAFVTGRIKQLAQLAFPEHQNVTWQVMDMRHRGPISDIVVVPQPNTPGFPQMLFLLSFESGWPEQIDAIYGYQGNKFVLISSGAGIQDGQYPAILSPE